ncbi:MAG: hypothetical protein LBB38_04305 [Puniceicoccales bacterium]|nr:hypothetical protein [Puniceicoccales bacterium]
MRFSLVLFFLAPLLEAPAHGDGSHDCQVGFSIPSYGPGGELLWDANGSYTESVDKTGKILLHSPTVSLFSSNGMRIRTLLFESQSAEFDVEGGRISGDGIVHIVGCGFTAIGERWTFFSRERLLRVDGHVQVFFETEQATGDWQLAGDDRFTATSTGGLLIEDCAGTFSLRFSRQTSLRAQNYSIQCDELTVEIPLPCGEEILGQKLPAESFRMILASGNVRMDDPERHMAADEVRIFPGNDGAIILSGNVKIIEGGEEVSGQRALIRGDRHCILATEIPGDGEPILDID